jgi:hypothetical protein
MTEGASNFSEMSLVTPAPAKSFAVEAAVNGLYRAGDVAAGN